MTPRALDWRSVERKLTRMRRLIDQLVALGPFDARRFTDEPVAGLAAEAGTIDPELAAALAPSAGLCNVLVHACLDVEHVRVAEATAVAPDLFGEYVRQVSSWFADRPDAG